MTSHEIQAKLDRLNNELDTVEPLLQDMRERGDSSLYVLALIRLIERTEDQLSSAQPVGLTFETESEA